MGMGSMLGSSDIQDMLVNYNERFVNADPAMFRDAHVRQLMSVLIRKNKPNPLMLGDAGVGKTRIVEELARLIENKDPNVPKRLQGKTVYELPLGVLVAGAGVVGELEQRVVDLVDFVSDKKNKAILFIDEIHMLQDKHDPTYKKVAQILKPALARGDMHLIGATTTQESKAFDKDPAFRRRFEPLTVDELTREQTVQILYSARASYLLHHKGAVSIQDDVLEKVAQIADENSRASLHRPDNALTLLDGVFAEAIVSHQHAVKEATAAGNQTALQVLKNLSPIPVSEGKVRQVALLLMTGFASREAFDLERCRRGFDGILGQGAVIDRLVEVLQRDALEVFPRKKPLTLMLAGPSGTGKTEAAKRIATSITGQSLISLNMNEFTEKHSVSRIIGSPPGYVGSEDNDEKPFDSLQSNPYRVILLDEFEKADKAVHRLFLTAFDEGWMRMANGRIIDFSKTIIIVTTNAGREAMTRTQTGFQTGAATPALTEQQLVRALQEAFDAELLGRMSQRIAFQPIDEEVYGQILSASYERERERIVNDSPRLAGRLPATMDSDLLAERVESTYLAAQGARPAEAAARRAIEDLLIAPVAPAPMGQPAIAGTLAASAAGPAAAITANGGGAAALDPDDDADLDDDAEAPQAQTAIMVESDDEPTGPVGQVEQDPEQEPEQEPSGADDAEGAVDDVDEASGGEDETPEAAVAADDGPPPLTDDDAPPEDAWAY